MSISAKQAGDASFSCKDIIALKRFIFRHPHCADVERESCRWKVGRFKNMKIPHLSRNTEIATDTGFDDRSSERQKFQALRRGDQTSK